MIAKKGNNQTAQLYMKDETAWLEVTARLIKAKKYKEIDYKNLAEFLKDMALRDRRQVMSRLVALMMHLLKWQHQPERRSGSWRASILAQRGSLRQLLASKSLKNHAETVLDAAYADAVELAAAETDLDEHQFPVACPFTVDGLQGETVDELLKD